MDPRLPAPKSSMSVQSVTKGVPSVTMGVPIGVSQTATARLAVPTGNATVGYNGTTFTGGAMGVVGMGAGGVVAVAGLAVLVL